ncbi:MAG: type II toxin-antitoxin system VapC family toxin [Acidobacteriota bacterium]|nr:type II toxin-antitoxin system VapC family toxin [Blastocatellia bacterium]MDW8239708.1 type II toxin-antitoxin system VapC family toxin [Acidobacteriota bacterium]
MRQTVEARYRNGVIEPPAVFPLENVARSSLLCSIFILGGERKLMSDSFDRSSITKQHARREIESFWMESLFSDPQTELRPLSQLVMVEVTSAFYRKWREGKIAQPKLKNMLRSFREAVLRAEWLEQISDSSVQSAVDLTQRRPSRAYAALERATALSRQAALRSSGQAVLFLSADDRLVPAARSEGLQADNPNLH